MMTENYVSGAIGDVLLGRRNEDTKGRKGEARIDEELRAQALQTGALVKVWHRAQGTGYRLKLQGDEKTRGFRELNLFQYQDPVIFKVNLT